MLSNIFNLRYKLSILIAFTFLLWSSSCSNDFVLTEPSSDIAIVYGMLTSNDTANYFRIERAFIDENTSALVLAKDPAQLYFDNAIVTLTNKRTNKSFILSRVDGNTEGYKRDAGVFADAPNYLYKLPSTTHNPIPGDTYEIKIEKGDRIIGTGSAKMLPSYSDGDLFEPGASSSISFGYMSNFNFGWASNDDAVIHDVRLVFNYRELKDGVFTNKSVTWNVARNYFKTNLSENNNNVTVRGVDFYTWLKSAIPVDPQAKRLSRDMEIYITSGGVDLLSYVSVGQANLGITSSGEIPVFTNLKGDALGIFSSKTNLIRKQINISVPTQDSIRRGIYTKQLGFQ
jgi:hypothetical protein